MDGSGRGTDALIHFRLKRCLSVIGQLYCVAASDWLLDWKYSAAGVYLISTEISDLV